MISNKKKETFFKAISEELQFDIMDYFQPDELEDINDYEELEYELQEQGAYDIEIIYYNKAMDYLMENDNSLRESMEIASEYDYKTENINSELLASLLASRNARDEFSELKDRIEEFFNN